MCISEVVINYYIMIIDTNLIILFNRTDNKKLSTYYYIILYLFSMLTNANNPEYIKAIEYLINHYIAICSVIKNDYNISKEEEIFWSNMINSLFVEKIYYS